MDWKSTALINATTLGLTLTQISESVKIGAMIVGIIWTFIQIANGVNQFTDRKERLASIKKEEKRRKKERDDKKLRHK
tara:strand:+ start:276 stop:509 length:234 start_codon:yes stop_codon:yes gene_type:complete